MKFCFQTLPYFIGILLFPSCVLLCLIEFLWKITERYDERDENKFYFIKSMDWFVKLETNKDVVKGLTIATTTAIVVIIALILNASTAQAAEWNSVYSQNVHSSQNISVNNITISNIQFSPPVTGHMQNGKLVLDYPASPTLFISNINGKAVQIVLSEGDVYTDNVEEFRIQASGFTTTDSILWEYSKYNPTANLTIYTWKRELPSLNITITPQYSSVAFGRSDSINVAVDFKNTGNVPITADIVPDFRSLHPNVKQRISIAAKTTQTLNYPIKILQQYGVHDLIVFVTVQNAVIANPDGTSKNTTFEFSSSATIEITPPSPDIVIEKIVPSRLYTCIYTNAVIVIHNNGIFDIQNISVVDKVPSTFAADKSINIWNIPELKSREQASLFVRMAPTRGGIYSMDAAEVRYKISTTSYSGASNMTQVEAIETGKPCNPAELIQSVEIYKIPIQVSSEETVEVVQINRTPTSTFPPTSYVFNTTPTPQQRAVPTETPIKLIPGFEGIAVIIVLLALWRAHEKK